MRRHDGLYTPAIRGDGEADEIPRGRLEHAGAKPRERPAFRIAAAEGTSGPCGRPAIRLCAASAQQRPRYQLAAAPRARPRRVPDHALDDGGGVDLGALAGRRARQALAQRHARALVAAGEQPVVAHLGEAVGQHARQEAADELHRVERAALHAVAVLGVAIVELDAPAVERGDAAVRYRHAVRVAAQVGQHAAGVAERLLAVDHPVALVQPGNQPVERIRAGEAAGRAVESQVGTRPFEALEQLAPEDL